jgi:hypothetical protein
VAVVQYTFTHKQHTENRERNKHNNQKTGIYTTIQKIKTNLGSSYTLAFDLQLRKKHGKTSVRVAARTSQADTVPYKKNEQYNTHKKNRNKE